MPPKARRLNHRGLLAAPLALAVIGAMSGGLWVYWYFAAR